MRPKKTVKKDSQKFQEILDAGARVFFKKGYHHANISDIAREVGMLKGSLYYYIKSKEELLSFIISPSIDIYVNKLEEILNSDEPADVMLEKAITAHMNPFDIDFATRAVFIKELLNLPETTKNDVLAQVAKYRKLWLQLIQKGISEGVFRKDIDTKIIVLSILGITNWTTRWFRPGGDYLAKDIGVMYTQLILNGLKAK